MQDLRIESIAFTDFRNYRKLTLDDLGALTVFTGRNAIGKTNILEGVQLLTQASTFRNAQISQLVREGAARALLNMRASDGNRQLDLSLLLEPGKRRYSVNGKHKHAADVRGVLPSVSFTPDDLQLVKKSSSAKRDALDGLGMQLTGNYSIVKRDYEKTVRYKNRLLHDEAPEDLVASINETLITCGAPLACYRMRLFERMVPHVARIYGQLAAGEGSNEPFTASYVPSWMRLEGGSGATDGEGLAIVGDGGGVPDIPTMREHLATHLSAAAREERRRARSLVGPHADGISFALSGRDASQFASQGQQRSIVLAWKLAEVELVREVLGVRPVLLLDDVLSELDGARREMLVGFVTADIQTFVTATDLDGFAPELVERARVVALPVDEFDMV